MSIIRIPEYILYYKVLYYFYYIFYIRIDFINIYIYIYLFGPITFQDGGSGYQTNKRQ